MLLMLKVRLYFFLGGGGVREQSVELMVFQVMYARKENIE